MIENILKLKENVKVSKMLKNKDKACRQTVRRVTPPNQEKTEENTLVHSLLKLY